MKILITNNPRVKEKYQYMEKLKVVYLENSSLLETLKKVRDEIHMGAKLLTHPLTSSIKPDETPFKSIIIQKNESNSLKIDMDSLMMITNSIEVVEKFLRGKNPKIYTQDILDDFQIIDLTTITSGIESMGG